MPIPDERSYTPGDRLTARAGVHARPMFEFVDDICTFWEEANGGHEEHELCLSLWVAARWPDPAPEHDDLGTWTFKELLLAEENEDDENEDNGEWLTPGFE